MMYEVAEVVSRLLANSGVDVPQRNFRSLGWIVRGVGADFADSQ